MIALYLYEEKRKKERKKVVPHIQFLQQVTIESSVLTSVWIVLLLWLLAFPLEKSLHLAPQKERKK